MPKTPRKTRQVCISLPIELDDFLDTAVESARSKGQAITKSYLIAQVLTLSIFESRQWSEENKQREQSDSKEA